MVNKQTNYFEGDLYLATSQEPTIYGDGSLTLEGQLVTSGYSLNGSISGSITIQAQATTGTYNFNLPTSSGTSGQVLTSAGGGSNAMTWSTPAGGGTVTSVAVSVPTFLSVSGSPITSSGTITLGYSGVALPVANGGTGATASTGSGSVVLQTSPSLTTPNIGVASGTSLSVTGNLNSLTKSITGSTSGVITIRGQAVAGTYNFNLPTSSGTSGQVLTSAGGASNAMSWTTPTVGTVTSVAVSVPAFLSVSGSPITSSGTITLGLSGTALPVLNGGTGTTSSTGSGSVVLQTSPTLTTPNIGVASGTSLSVTGNINSLTQSITGSTSGVITIQGQAVAGTYNFNLPTTSGTVGQVLTSGGGGGTAMTWTSPGGGGTVTSVAVSVPAFLSVSGSPITTSGTIALSLSGTALPVANGGTGSTSSTGSGSVVLQTSPSLTTPNIGVASGTSLSVTGNINSLFYTITGSISGVVTIVGQNNSGTYNFNIPTTSGISGQVLTSQGGGSNAMTWTTPTVGTVTSVAVSVPAFLSVSGSPITTSGTIALSLSGTALPVANGGTGSTSSTGSGSVVLQTSPSLTTPNIGVASGTSLSVTGNLNSLTKSITGSTSGVITIQGQAVAGTYNFNLPTTSGTVGQVLTSGGGGGTAMTWTSPGGGGTVTSVAVSVPAFLSVSGSPITTSGTIALTLSGTALPVLNGGTGTTTSTGSGSVVLQTSPSLTTPNIGVASGTSLSVTGNINSLTKSITGSTSGVITIQGQAVAGTYNFNLPTTSGTVGQVLTSGGGGGTAMTWTSPGGGGTVTSVAVSVPAFLSVSGSPITTSGTIALSLSGTALPVLNGGTGTTTSTGSGSVVLQTSPSLTTPNIGVASGTSLSVTGNVNSLTHTIFGSSTGVITIRAAQADSGTYNFNLPNSNGLAGQFLFSGGGNSSPMVWAFPTRWYITDQKPTGTNGGTFNSGSFVTRTLNTITSSQTDTAVTINTNEITIGPGRYHLEISVPAYRVDNNKARLFNITDNTIEAEGTSEFADNSASGSSTRSFIILNLTLTSTKVYRVEHRGLTTRGNDGFGLATGFGTEVYTTVYIINN